MFLLAGLMGMMAVGAVAYISLNIPEVFQEDKADTCGIACEKMMGCENTAISRDFSDPVARENIQTDTMTCDGSTHTSAIGAWLDHGHQAEVADFSTDEDSLLVVYDDQNSPDPKIGIERDEVDRARHHVTLDGVRITAVDNAEGLTLGHITLVGQSMLNFRRAA